MSEAVNSCEDSLLEPDDWLAFREEAHRALDVALDFVQQRPGQPVWAEIPEGLKNQKPPLPLKGSPLQEVVTEVQEQVLPHTLGNTHPRFWGWVNGSGTPSGIVSHMLTAAINANMGGRDHSPIYIERQLISWMRTLFDFPESASGLICTGTSMATLLGLAVARHRVGREGVRQRGNASAGELVAYCSAEAHVSVAKAVELLGLGREALRAIPVTEQYEMDCSALGDAIQRDLDGGKRPFAVVSCAGSVNTGAIDDLTSINTLCSRFGLWHHVDGAFGALIALSENLRSKLNGIEQADSLAFDFHKWMHVTYASACLLVRDSALHREAFATSQSYLLQEDRGAAGGAPWPNDFGIDLSRGFTALGAWMQLKEMGVEKLGLAIERNCEQAFWLAQRVLEAPALELMAPVSLNIVCLRYVQKGLSQLQLDELNRQLVVELQCRGIAVPSSTVLAGRCVIRVCITNHRTRRTDLQALLDSIIELAPLLLPAILR